MCVSLTPGMFQVIRRTQAERKDVTCSLKCLWRGGGGRFATRHKSEKGTQIRFGS